MHVPCGSIGDVDEEGAVGNSMRYTQSPSQGWALRKHRQVPGLSPGPPLPHQTRPRSEVLILDPGAPLLFANIC